MTLTSTTDSTSITGDGSTTDIATGFAFKGTGATAELEVVSRVIATGVETVQTYTTHYTVTGGEGSTGTVIAVTAPASTVEWHIRRTTTQTQLTDYTTNDAFPADTHEAALDRVMMIANELQSILDRCLKFPVTDASLTSEFASSVDRANKNMGFDANGNVELTTTVGDWKGAWVTSTAYVVNDIVSNSGNSYICIVAHTSGTFATDLAALKWELVAQKGDTGAAGTLSNIVEDATPQLGGFLDTNSKFISLSEGAVVASVAGDTDVWGNYDGNTVHISGTNAITDFGTPKQAGDHLWVIFDAAASVVDSATITVDGNANFQAAAGDFALIYAISTSTFYFKPFPNAGFLRPNLTANLTKGFTATENDVGDTGTTTITLDAATANFWKAQNGGAHTLTPQTATSTIILYYLNAADAGTVTTSGYDIVTGDALTTTNTEEFMLYSTTNNGKQHLHVVALQ